jgi:hypothetical protein
LKFNSFLPKSDEYYITENKQGGYYLIEGILASSLYVLDSNLNEIKTAFEIPKDYYNIEDDFTQPVGMQWKNDTTLTVFTTDGYQYRFQIGYYEITIINGECKSSEKDYYYYFSIKDPNELAAECNAVDRFRDYTFFTARTNVIFYSSNPRDTNATRIIKLDKNNSVIWDNVYDFNAWHWITSIDATKDGGCLAVGNEICFTCPKDRRNLYILKTDSIGYVEGAEIIDNITQNQVSYSDIYLYPNPGSTAINLQLPAGSGNAELCMFNISGKKIMTKQVAVGLNTFSTQDFLPGIYFYTVTCNGKVLSKGKWIKE